MSDSSPRGKNNNPSNSNTTAPFTFKRRKNKKHNIIIISDMIDSKYSEISENPCQIDALPCDVFQKCASYLNINDYMNFALCNRIIYSSVNSPNKLQKLNICDRYNMINLLKLNRFSMIKSLCIHPKTFNK
eukprot:204834_1